MLKTALASLCGIVFLSSPALSADAHDEGDHDHEFCVGPDPVAEAGFLLPDAPDFFETYPDGSLPRPEASKESVQSTALAPAATQPIGALTGKIVYMSGGHGWTYANGSESITRWYTQRGINNEMNEDYGNMDQMTLFAYYCFNAGATVVPIRPVGHQTNEVVLDNVSPGVTWNGSWSNSGSTLYFGSAGQTPYRFASIAASETATATYTPNIPVAGFYPVYAWARHGSDRTAQLYRIRHTGGESQVRIPHDKVGNGWVYIGSYYFNAGSSSANGAVVISNLRPNPTYGSVVIADAIRFGNGMGDVVPTPKDGESTAKSTYPREEEASRYWIQRGLGQGQSTSLYNPSGSDNSDNVGAPARMSREMNRAESGPKTDRVYIGFHSNAGGGRGCVGLYNSDTLFPGSSTPNQARLALLVATEMDSDMKVLPLEVTWQSRSTLAYARSDYAFGEIRGNSIGYEMDSTIIETAFHDSESDARLMRDPKVRNWMARSTYQGIMRYFSEFSPGFVLTYIPEPPHNVRAVASPTGITVSWNTPIASRRSGAATDYVIYRSTDGYGFANPVTVGSSATSIVLSGLPNNTDMYFRVAAVNAGGESLPSEVVGCRRDSNSSAQRVLVVNAFPRLDRFTNLRHSPSPNAWKAPGNSGTMERVFPRSNNSFDYVAQYGKAINAFNIPFDSCSKAAVNAGQINLANYGVVIWAAGQELTSTIDSTAQSRLTTFLQNGGSVFVSGSEVARDLGRATSPSASRTFLQNRLHVTLASETHTNSQAYTVVPASSAILVGKGNATFDNGTKGIYWVRSPDIVTASGSGARSALTYSGGLGGSAAVQYDGSGGGGRVVFFGFPFETITSAATRNSYMAEILAFLSAPPPTGSPIISAGPASQTVNRYADVAFDVAVTGQPPLYFQWRFNGANLLGETNETLELFNVQTNQAGQYSVVVSNSINTAISSAATLNVVIPTVTDTFFTDNFDTQTSANWITNSSSTNTRVTFNYNYANDHIPSAPNSVGGTRRGVKFEANMVAPGATAALNISPAGKSFTGDYDLKFDLWINANGPFPLGGTGSTEHFTTGVGTIGSRVQWGGAGTTADGTWFAVDGEGEGGDTTEAILDFMVYRGATLQSTNTGIYSAGTAANARGNRHPYYHGAFPGGQTAPAAQVTAYPNQSGPLAAGTVGMKWRDVMVRKRGTTVDWIIDGLRIASVTNAVFNGNNVFIGYWDAYASISDNTAMSFGLVDNIRVERTTEAVFPAFTLQPQNRTVIQGSNVTFTASATGTTNLFYQWRLDDLNISGATSSAYTISNVQLVHEGAYSVVVTNIAGKITSNPATLTVLVPPTILTQPQPLTVTRGSAAEFTVEVEGTQPLSFQWRLNGLPLDGATESSFILGSTLPEHVGNYSVVVTNAAGLVTSDAALLSIENPPLQFGSILINESNEPSLTINGTPGTQLSIEISANLVNWISLTNIVIGEEGLAEFTDLFSETNAQRFYRAIAVE
ncbi:MAG: immunoglobulin domain-containing protein [Verrucomicrobia bacterium]|nr:immunoglobulin domain-containing protein [Verrucomicrobiota bacterium]